MPLTTNSAGKFCWKLFDSCLWPEKAPVQEKLPLTLNVPGTVGGEDQHESMDVGTQILLERLLHWEGITLSSWGNDMSFWSGKWTAPQSHNTGLINQMITLIHCVGLDKKRCTCHFFSFLNKENVIWLHDGFKSYFLAEMCLQICLTRLFTLGWVFSLAFILLIQNQNLSPVKASVSTMEPISYWEAQPLSNVF